MQDYLSCEEVDIGKIRKNIEVIERHLLPGCGIIAVVKGDAYGMGMVSFLKEMEKYDKILMAAVATLEEARECLIQKTTLPVLILNHILPSYGESVLMEKGQVIFSLYNREDAVEFNRLALKNKVKIKVHIRIDLYDTGKGFSIEEYRKEEKMLLGLQGLSVEGIYAQVYSSYTFYEKYVHKDVEPFDLLVREMPKEQRKQLMVHLETSVMLYSYPQYQYDGIRLGAALYGFPISENPAQGQELAPIMRIYGRITAIDCLKEGKYLDYMKLKGEDLKVKKIGLVSLGYWDAPGLMTARPIHVWINGMVTQIVGEPCMDACYVNLDGIAGVKKGDKAVLLGPYSGVSLRDKMKENGRDHSDCQMLLCGNGRLPKIYVESFSDMFSQVLQNAPVLAGCIRKHGDSSLSGYLNTICPASCPIEEEESFILDAVRQQAEEQFGQELAEQTVGVIRKTGLFHTANHMSAAFFPQSIQGNLLYYHWLRLRGEEAEVIPLFCTTNITMESEDFPRGILFSHGNYQEIPAKIPVMPHRKRMEMVGAAEGYTVDMVLKAEIHCREEQKKGIITEKTCGVLLDILGEYRKAVSLKGYVSQAVEINRCLGKKILRENQEFLYLSLDGLCRKLAISGLKNPKSLLSQILLNENLKQAVIRECDGAAGCWGNGSLRRIKEWKEQERLPEKVSGTHFFWGVDSQNRRYPFFLSGDGSGVFMGITTKGERVVLKNQPESLIAGLQNGSLIPCLFVDFLLLYFTGGFSLAGGCFQGTYVGQMKKALERAFKRNMEKSRVKKDCYYMSGPVFLADGAIPWGTAEFLEAGGVNKGELEALLNHISCQRAHELGMFYFYPDIIPNQIRNPNWKRDLKQAFKNKY